MKPTIGRVVHYHTTSAQRIKMNNSNTCNVSELLPAVIVAVWSKSLVNLKVHMDGDFPDIWVTSANEGKLEGQWEWPVMEPNMTNEEAKNQ